MRIIAALLLVVGLALPLSAQDLPDGVFDDYDALRDRMDDLVKSRSITELMLAFGGADEMTMAELRNLEVRVKTIYPRDFEQVELIRVQQLENGWRQELLTYYSGIDYFYVYVLIHERADAAVAVNFKFNSDFGPMNANF